MSEVKPLWTALGKFDVRKEELSSNNSQLPLLSVTQNSGVVRYADLFPDRCQRAEDLNRYKVVSIGDIVLNTMSAGTGAVGVAKEPGVVSPDYSTFRPRIGFDSTFLYYCLKSRDFLDTVRSLLRGIGTGDGSSVRTPRIGLNDYLHIKCYLPDLEIQRRIADRLDRETGEIDSLVKELDEYVGLLEKRNKAVVAQAVIGGERGGVAGSVDQTPGLTNSHGAFWLDSIPANWDLVPAWTVWQERSERCHDDDVHLTPSQTHGVISQQEYMEITGSKVVLNLSSSANMKHVEPGDFIIHLRSFQGGLEYSKVAGKVSNAYTVLRPAIELVPSYFRWLFKSAPFISGLAGSTDQMRDGQSINFKKFSTFSLPLPDLETQRRIADRLDRETAETEALIKECTALKELLLKRRQVLITDMVTGKVEV